MIIQDQACADYVGIDFGEPALVNLLQLRPRQPLEADTLVRVMATGSDQLIERGLQPLCSEIGKRRRRPAIAWLTSNDMAELVTGD